MKKRKKLLLVSIPVCIVVLAIIILGALFDNRKQDKIVEDVADEVLEIVDNTNSIEKQMQEEYVLTSEWENEFLFIKSAVQKIDQHYSLDDKYKNAVDKNVMKHTDFNDWELYKEYIISRYLPYDDYKENAQFFMDNYSSGETFSEEAQECQGTWVSYVGNKSMDVYIQIDGEKITRYYSDGLPQDVKAEFGTKNGLVYIKMEANSITDWYSLMKDESGKSVLNDCSNEDDLENTNFVKGYKKVSDDIATITSDQTPYVGMSRADLIFSSWGEPKDKNITKTASGTSEQWVYAIDKYVYLEDDIVTAIQE